MSLLCPSCSARLEDGALRCRYCGADARSAPRARGVGASFFLTAVLSLDQERTLQLLEGLEQLAPEVRVWMKNHPKERARLLEKILDALYGADRKR